ncbi:MAG: T9SS type A sorting domain-containing protein [Bacteroidia bacterium]
MALALVAVSALQVVAQCSVSLGADTSLCAAGFTLDPALSIATFEDSLEIVYDATQGQSGLAGATKVYMHSGAEMVPFGGWQYPVGNWGQDDGIGRMTSLGNDRWRIRILPHSYYGYSASATPNGLFMVFRNADGTATGKDASGNDIWVDMSQDPPTSAFTGVQCAWKRDALDSLHWSDGSNGATLTVSGPGTYWVTMYDTSGCTASDTVQVNLGQIPVVDLGQPAICNGAPVILDAGPGYAQYAWSTGASTQTITVATASLITVTVTNSAGCTGIDIVNVPSANAPSAQFFPSATGLTVQFVDGSTGGGTYQWQFLGNGFVHSTNAGTTSWTYQSPGTYNVTLIVTNPCGTDTFTQAVAVGGVGAAESAVASASISLFPNPATDRIILSAEFPKPSALEWAIVDAQGRICVQGQEGRKAGIFRKELDIHLLPAGYYVMRLQSGGTQSARSFIKN